MLTPLRLHGSVETDGFQDAINRSKEGIQKQLRVCSKDIQGRRHFHILVRCSATAGKTDVEWGNRLHDVSVTVAYARMIKTNVY